MIGMLLPELVIYNSLISIIKMLRVDLEEHSNDETHGILYRLFSTDEQGNPLQINLMNIYTQAKKIITNKGNLSVNYGYNQKVAQNISLHIILPQENSTMAIGADEGYLSEYTKDADGNVISENMYLTQMYKSTYQVMITSNNSAEVMIVYNILKSMLLMLVPQLELMGLRTPTFSGNDIVMQDDLSPVPIFHKVINISFQYEHNVPQHIVRDAASRFYVRMRAVLDGDDKDTPIPEPEKRTLQILSNGKYGVYSIDEVDVKVLPTHEERTITITENGTYEILPENADTLSKVEVITYIAPITKGIRQLSTEYVGFLPYIFDFTGLTSAYQFASNCSKLTGIGGVINTSSVTDARNMFYNCSKLTSVDVSKWNLGSVTTMRNMFCGCTSLTTLDCSNWDTGSVTDMLKMFYNCSKLTTIDCSKWDTGKVKAYTDVYSGCTQLKSIIGDHTLAEVESGKIVANKNAGTLQTSCGLYSSSSYIRYSSILALANGLYDRTGMTVGTFWLTSKEWNALKNDDDTAPSSAVLLERQTTIKTIVNKKNFTLSVV